MAPKPSDLTHSPDLLLPHGTGPQRLQRPNYVDLLPPCNNACPAGEDIQAWLALAQDVDTEFDQHVADPSAFERANYIILEGYKS